MILTDVPLFLQDVPLFLQDLERSLEAMAWLKRLDCRGNLPAWSWTSATLMHDIDLTVRTITQFGGLLLIGGLYLKLDRAAS